MNIGEKVRLKSGGPMMTVRSVNNNIVSCEWFTKDKDENYISEEKDFPIDMLLDEEELKKISEENLKLQLRILKKRYF